MKVLDYAKTLVLVAIMLYLALQKGNGFFPLLLLMFIIATLVNLVRTVRGRGERKKYAIRLGIWTATLVLVGAVQTHWSNASRNDADIAVKAVLANKARSGSYPASLKVIGIDEEELHAKWGIRYFVRAGGQVVLTYPSSIMPLTMNDYDFESRKWVVNAP
jgi:hypothetical protein